MQIHMHMHMHIPSHVKMHMHMHMRMHMHKFTFIYMCMHMHVHMRRDPTTGEYVSAYGAPIDSWERWEAAFDHDFLWLQAPHTCTHTSTYTCA